MTTENQVQMLVTWLESHPGEAPPDGLDTEVIEAVYALRPDLAPAPRIGIDDILARVESGPFAVQKAQKESARMSPAWIWGGGGLAAAAMALFLVLPMQDEVAEMPLPNESIESAPPPLIPAPELEPRAKAKEGLGDESPSPMGNIAAEGQSEGAPRTTGRAPAPRQAESAIVSEQVTKSENYAIDFESVDEILEPADELDLEGLLTEEDDIGELGAVGSGVSSGLGSRGMGQGGGGFGSAGVAESSTSSEPRGDYDSETRPQARSRSRREIAASPPAVAAVPESDGGVTYQEQAASIEWAEDSIGSASAQTCAGPSTPLETTGNSSEETQALVSLRAQIESQRSAGNPQAAAMLAADRIADTNADVAQEFALRAALLSLENGNLAMALGYLEQGKSRQATGTHTMRLFSLEGEIYALMGQQERAEEAWAIACRLGE